MRTRFDIKRLGVGTRRCWREFFFLLQYRNEYKRYVKRLSRPDSAVLFEITRFGIRREHTRRITSTIRVSCITVSRPRSTTVVGRKNYRVERNIIFTLDGKRLWRAIYERIVWKKKKKFKLSNKNVSHNKKSGYMKYHNKTKTINTDNKKVT